MGLARGEESDARADFAGRCALEIAALFSFLIVAIAMVAAIAQPGCGLWQENVTAEHRDTAEQVEPLLEQAGF